jgi:hypothetical protein
MRQRLIIKALKIVDDVFWTDFHIKLRNKNIGFHNANYQLKTNEIALVHVPKTGGTSLVSILRKDKLSRFVNLNTHSPVSQLCAPQKYNYITVMRDPIERVWSYYQMVLQSSPSYPYKLFANKGLSCFLKYCWEARNMSCRYYSGQIAKEPTEQTLQNALNNLKHFCAVINFENYEEEVNKFLARYDLKTNLIPHKRKKSYELPNEYERQLISHYNSLDIELFDRWNQRI